jgi:AcrR family transcriptional regulator
MVKTNQDPSRDLAKRVAVYEAAAKVFARYGFKRTTMNDVAQAAGISRPALYLMFDNKEHLFHELAAFRLDQAIEKASSVLASKANVQDRFIDALLDYEKIYYEPVMNSPHGEELMDINQSLATDMTKEGYTRLVTTLATALREAEAAGEVDFANSPLKPKPFVELLLASITGIKKKVSTTAEFRKKIRQVSLIFLQAIAVTTKP